MKLLIIGDHGVLARSIINTVAKSGWEICMLIGRTGSAPKPPKVFEQYLFPYDNENITEVIEAISPDIALFMGPYDKTFGWSDIDHARTYYTAALVNLLSACEKVPHLKFFYFSSQEVFANDQGHVSETDQPHPKEERGQLILLGESICRLKHDMTGMDTFILRLDHPYGLLEDRTEASTLFERFVIDACLYRECRITDSNRFSGIFISDAAEAVYRIIAAREHIHRLYHISSEEEVDKAKLSEILRREPGKLTISAPAETSAEKAPSLARTSTLLKSLFGYRPRHSYEENAPCLVLTSTLLKPLFGFRMRHPYEESVHHLYTHTKQNLAKLAPPDEYAKQRNAFVLKLKRVFKLCMPFAVNIIGVSLAFMGRDLLARYGLDGTLDLPFLYTLIISGLFGRQHALLCATLLAGLEFLASGNLFDLLMDYNTYIWVAKLFIGGMLVGGLRDRQSIVEAESEEESHYLQVKLDEVKHINDQYRRVNRAYENRLIEYQDILGKIYQLTSALNAQQPGEVLFSAALSVGELMHTGDVAIYRVANDNF